MKNEKDVNKLTSIDENGKRLDIIPAEVKGFFRTQRTRLQMILLVIFLGTPWISYSGQQIILLDIQAREFIFFGVTLKSHDAPLIFLLIALATLGLALITSIWGRIWCGWACPQTVFIDAVYRQIEIWTEGNYRERRHLQKAPLSFSLLRKKISKWGLFIIFSSVFAHSFVAYFIGSKKLIQMIEGTPTENWSYFLTVSFMTALLLFNFGWFREQFCVIMCPYGRIQSVLLDSSSLSVVYDEKRGEPRRGLATPQTTQGSCVNCHRCIEVCPTGIDIRHGLQMECINCTACIDACDDIMKKTHQPPGLIRFQTLDQSPLKIFKFKSISYMILILFALGILIFNLQTRASVNIAVLRGIDTPYSQDINSQGDIQILNHFRLHLNSQSDKDMRYEIILSEKDQQRGLKLTLSPPMILLKAKSSETWHLFFHLPLASLPKNGQLDLSIVIKSSEGELISKNLTFLGPQR